VVATLGWLVTYLQQQWSKRRDQERDFLRRQLEEFYAPLFALIQLKNYVQQVQDARMERIEPGDRWVKTLRYFEDNHIVPAMKAISEILRTKSYLADDWPKSFDQYLEHEAKSVALYLYWRTTDIPGDVVVLPMPDAILNDVKVRKECIEARLRKMYGFDPTDFRTSKRDLPPVPAIT